MGDFDNREREEVFSKKVRAGKRTYFFDVKATRSNDYYVTITESKKRLEDGVFIKHKIFLYKEDFNKFLKALTEAIDYVKTDLMPDFDFDAYNHDQISEMESDGVIVDQIEIEPVAIIEEVKVVNIIPVSTVVNNNEEEVDKW